MEPVGDFLSEQFRHQIALPRTNSDHALEAESTSIVSLEGIVPPDAAKLLVTGLSQYVASAQFAEAVNQEVSPPKPDESEDDFVSRAKETIRKKLMERFLR